MCQLRSKLSRLVIYRPKRNRQWTQKPANATKRRVPVRESKELRTDLPEPSLHILQKQGRASVARSRRQWHILWTMAGATTITGLRTTQLTDVVIRRAARSTKAPAAATSGL